MCTVFFFRAVENVDNIAVRLLMSSEGNDIALFVDIFWDLILFVWSALLFSSKLEACMSRMNALYVTSTLQRQRNILLLSMQHAANQICTQ